MISKKLFVKNDLGVHARPSGLIVRKLSNFKSQVTFKHDELQADGRDVLKLMSLGLAKGDEFEVFVEGEDENEVLDTIEQLFNSLFDEAY
jgi:phosphocarrier protein